MPEASIIIVEDDSAVADVLKTLLEMHSPKRQVRVATTLGEALAFLRDNPTQYKLITLDLDLIDARNLQGLKILKQQFPLIPVGIITGAASYELELEAEDEGAIFYLTKPIRDTKATHTIINRALNIWWIQYGICRKAWESEQHAKLTVQMREESPIESPRLKRWQFWAGVVAAITTAGATVWAFGKEIVQAVLNRK